VRKLIREQRVDELGDVMDSAGDGHATFNRALVQLYEKGKLITSRPARRTPPTPTSFASTRRAWSAASAAFVAEHEALPALGSPRHAHAAQDRAALRRERPPPRDGLAAHLPHPRQARRLEGDSLSASDVRRLLFSLLSHKQRETFELDRELDFALTVTGQHRFRVNAHYQRGTIAVALRLIPNSIPDIAAAGHCRRW
jgi:Tfp pilus assembly pilus retraction ATPase PilT